MFEKIVFKNMDVPAVDDIQVYMQRGGYEALRAALRDWTPERLIDEVKKSGLRGRGGAGFPTGMKWGFVPKPDGRPHYLVVNADEGEPGTFKDRQIMERDPHLMIEGSILSAYAISAHICYVYIRGEFTKPIQQTQKAIAQAYEEGFLGKNILGSGYDLEMYVHVGAGAYICGEETGLLSSLEGKRGEPKVKPPFPATKGLFGYPTVVNNVETLANVPDILLKGVEWFRSMGTQKSPGTKVFSVSGHVVRPGNYEVELGMPLREIIYDVCGGIPNGKRLKGVVPGGLSAPFLTPDEIDVPMDFDALIAAGTMLGSGAIIVMDEDTCMVKVAARTAQFFAHESCGQCTQCREGTNWLGQVLQGIEDGIGDVEDLGLILDVCDYMEGQTICVLSDACAWPVRSTVKKWREEYEDHIRNKRCPFSHKRAAAFAGSG